MMQKQGKSYGGMKCASEGRVKSIPAPANPLARTGVMQPGDRKR